jgi:hypothetical protein
MKKQRRNNATSSNDTPTAGHDDTELRGKLLALGGTQVFNHGFEPHLCQLLKDGRLFPPCPVKKIRSARNCCHQYAALYYVGHAPTVVLVTGYALAGELWVQHSWCYREGNEPYILDPSGSAEKYFGVVLDDASAVAFVFGHLLTTLPGWKYLKEQVENGTRNSG